MLDLKLMISNFQELLVYKLTFFILACLQAYIFLYSLVYKLTFLYSLVFKLILLLVVQAYFACFTSLYIFMLDLKLINILVTF